MSVAVQRPILETPVKIGHGAVVLVVGPSGSGKDTLLREAAKRLNDRSTIIFPRRVITRESDPELEDHSTITREQFDSMVDGGEAALNWKAHGNGYIIPLSIDQSVREGATAVFNASRSVITDAMERYENVGVINITVPAETLAERLVSRGRESADEITRRLERASFKIPVGVDFINVVNDGSIENGTEAMIRAIHTFQCS